MRTRPLRYLPAFLAAFMAAIGLIISNSAAPTSKWYGEATKFSATSPVRLGVALWIGTAVVVLLTQTTLGAESTGVLAVGLFAASGIATSAVFMAIDAWNQVRKAEISGAARVLTVATLAAFVVIYAVVPVFLGVRAVARIGHLREARYVAIGTAGALIAMLFFAPYERYPTTLYPNSNCGYHFHVEDRDKHHRKDCNLDRDRFIPPLVAVAPLGSSASGGIAVIRRLQRLTLPRHGKQADSR